MTELEKWQLINSCETRKELTKALYEISSVHRTIPGKSQIWSTDLFVDFIDEYMDKNSSYSLSYMTNLTRNYGIRQQFYYILLLEKSK